PLIRRLVGRDRIHAWHDVGALRRVVAVGQVGGAAGHADRQGAPGARLHQSGELPAAENVADEASLVALEWQLVDPVDRERVADVLVGGATIAAAAGGGLGPRRARRAPAHP